MHSIVLLTAMTATTGLFGGHRQARTAGCQTGQCARPAAVAYAPATCRTGNCPTAYAAPAPAAYAPAAPAVTYQSAYYPPAASCATGTCPRR